jgi:hypothetical protein
MGKISKIRLQKDSQEWRQKGLLEEELIFLCGSGKPLENNEKCPSPKSKSNVTIQRNGFLTTKAPEPPSRDS